MVVELLLLNFGDVWEEVGEGIREVWFAPSAGLKQDIHDGLLLDEVVSSLSCESFGDTGGFHVIYA